MARGRIKLGRGWRVWAVLALVALLVIGVALRHQSRPHHPVAAVTLPAPISAEPPPQVAVTPPSPKSEPAWRRNAVQIGPEDGRPMIAIVLDDMGLDRRRSAEALALPGPLTLSFMAYAEALASQTADGRTHGQEIMLHVPMEPLSAHENPGPNALTVNLSDDEVQRRLELDLARIGDIVGANNHMGSRFTESAPGMTVVLTVLHQHGLFFLDSKTTAHSVGIGIAREIGEPHALRDVFLDDDMAESAVLGQLVRTEVIARRNGFAIAIGHPHDGTIAALRQWLPTVAAKGFRLVPVSAVVAHNETAEGRPSD